MSSVSADSTLPPGWMRCLSKRFNTHYYFNCNTNESVWDLPPVKNSLKSSSSVTSEEASSCYSRTSRNTQHTSRKPPDSLLRKDLCEISDDCASRKRKLSRVEKWASSIKTNGVNTTTPTKVPILKPMSPSGSMIIKNIIQSPTVSCNKSSCDNLEISIGTTFNRVGGKTKRYNSVSTIITPKSNAVKKGESERCNASKFTIMTPAMKKIVCRKRDDSSNKKPCFVIKSWDTTHKPNSVIKTKGSMKNSKDLLKTKSAVIKSVVKSSTGFSKKKIESKESPKTDANSNPFFKKTTEQLIDDMNNRQNLFPSTDSISMNGDRTKDFSIKTNCLPRETLVNRKNNELEIAMQTEDSLSQEVNIIPNSVVHFELKEEEMEIDDNLKRKRQILKEITQIRSENAPVKPEVASGESTTLPVYTHPLYIVLDTNILLGHLKFVSELKDYPIGGVGAPVLVIPWVVFQELDSLKDVSNRTHTQVSARCDEENSFEVNVLARQAIKFLNTCLEGGHPRIKGETVMEATTSVDGFTVESNDDQIVHCALALKTRAEHSHIVMLSNDVNLCNKSIVVGVKAFSKQNVMMGLRSLYRNATMALTKENFKEFYKEYKVQERISRKKMMADELSCELQCILRETFSKVIEDEMKIAYGENLWLQIVKIQPPWTLHDIFTLLKRHWIAVFGMVVQRSLESKISSLKESLEQSEGCPGDLDFVMRLMKSSLVILEAFFNHSNYDDMLTKAISALHLLLHKCTGYISDTTNLPSLPSTTHCPENGTAITADASTLLTASPYGSVMETFEAVWCTVRHFSALIFYGLGYPNPLLKDLNANDRKPSTKESLACLNILASCLLRVVKAIQSVLLVPCNEIRTWQTPIECLLEALKDFMAKVMKTTCALNREKLLSFIIDEHTRTTLLQGLSQLDHSYAMLQQCLDYVNN